jgi:hypothetical protein
MEKPSDLYFEVSRDGKLVYHLEIFFGLSRAARGHIDVEK